MKVRSIRNMTINNKVENAENFVEVIQSVISEAINKKIMSVDPYNDEKWMIDAMINGLRESLGILERHR